MLVHHLLVCSFVPVALGKPVLMRHLLRTWAVELHSWIHIAARTVNVYGIGDLARRVNKPAFVVLRLIGFPLTWFMYAAERSALPPAVLAAHAPFGLHTVLSCAHLGMYGLMLKWARGMLGS